MIVRHKNFTQAITVFFGIFTVTVLLAKQAGQHTGGYTNHAASAAPTGSRTASRTVANEVVRPFRIFVVNPNQVTGATERQLRRISNKEVESVELVFYPLAQITGGLYFQAIHHKVSRSGNQDYVIGTRRADQPTDLPPEFLVPGRELVALGRFEEVDRFTGLPTGTGSEVVGVDYENFRYGLGLLQLNYDCLWGNRVWVRNVASGAATVAITALTYKVLKVMAGVGPVPANAPLYRQVAARAVHFIENTWSRMEALIAVPMIGSLVTGTYLAINGWLDEHYFGTEHERIQRVSSLLTNAQISGGDALRYVNLVAPFDTERSARIYNRAIEEAEEVRAQSQAAGNSPAQIDRDHIEAYNAEMARGTARDQAAYEAQIRRTAPAFIRIASDDLAMDIQAIHRFMTFYASRDLASSHSRLLTGGTSGAGQCAGYTELHHTLDEFVNASRRALREGVDILTE